MKNMNNSGSNLVVNKVQINLNVLGTLMLHQVGREINDTDVAAVNKSSSVRRSVKFFK
jgi:hypothetical protein